MYCALFVFYFHYYVGVLLTNCFLLSLLRWCFAHYLFFNIHYYVGIFFAIFTITLVFFSTFTITFSIFTITLGFLRTIRFRLLLLRWCFAHYLFSTFTITLVFCALFVFYFHYYVGVLRTICFLL